jgi:Na+-translocating ferredoxin:NAD+ oxidoreductase RnfG subunit
MEARARVNRSRTFAAGLALVAAVAIASPPSAARSYWSRAELLKEMFSTSQRVDWVELTAEEATAALGAAHKKTVVYIARTGDVVDGFAIIEDVQGQHEPITFGVQVDTTGHIRRVEVMEYREAYGEEIRDPRFLRQLQGKTLSDAIKPGVDVDGITGATISSRSATVVARRALVLCAAAQKKLAAQKPAG